MIGRYEYMFPECFTVKDEDIFYHASKLSEETGEVCQAICKRKNPNVILEECVDVLWSVECIFRYFGIPAGAIEECMEKKIQANIDRGYIIDNKESRLF